MASDSCFFNYPTARDVAARLGAEDGVSTPQAARTREGQAARSASKVGGAVKNPHVVWLAAPHVVCGSNIGVKGKVCGRQREACTTASHVVTDRDTGLYLTAGEEGHFLIKPFAPLNDSTEKFHDSIGVLLRSDMNRAEWMAVIEALNDYHGAHSRNGKAKREEYLETMLGVLVERYVEGDEGERGEGWVFESTTLSPLPTRGRPLDDLSLEGTLEEQLASVRKQMQSEIASLNEQVLEASLCLRNVAAAHGTPGKGQGPTCEALADMVKRLKTMKGLLNELDIKVRANELRSQTNLASVTSLTTTHNELERITQRNNEDLEELLAVGGWKDQIEGHIRRVVDTLGGVDARMGHLDREVSTLTRRADASQGSGGGRLSGGSTIPSALEHRVQSLEGVNARSRLEALERTAIPTDSGVSREVFNWLMDDHADIKAKLMNLEAMSSTSEGRESFMLERWSFPEGNKSVDDFVHDNGIPRDTEDLEIEVATIINDVNQLLEQASNFELTEKADFAAMEVHAQKTGRPPSETELATAMQSMTPSCFTTSGARELTKIKTFKLFDAGDGLNGVGPRLLIAFREIRRANLVKINDELRDLQGLKDLATYTLNTTIDFLEALLHWVGYYYRTLITNTGASTEAEKSSCWKLTTSMLYTICEVLWETRRPAKHAHTYPARKKLVTYLTSSLRTQGVMAEFKRTHFSEHPRIFPKLMNFIFASHTPKIEFVALKEQVKAMGDQVSTLKRGQDAIMSRLTAVERKCGLGGGGWRWRRTGRGKE